MNASWLCGVTSMFAALRIPSAWATAPRRAFSPYSEKKFKSSTNTSSVVISLVSATSLLAAIARSCHWSPGIEKGDEVERINECDSHDCCLGAP